MNKPTAPDYYLIPGTDLELIDIIHAKLSDEGWQSFLYGSLQQYAFRCLSKGDAVSDLEKCMVYAGWLRDSVKRHGVCAANTKPSQICMRG